MRKFSLNELRYALAMFIVVTAIYVFIVAVMDAFTLSFFTRVMMSFGIVYVGSTIFYIAYRCIVGDDGE